jgi:hypothetical protein
LVCSKDGSEPIVGRSTEVSTSPECLPGISGKALRFVEELTMAPHEEPVDLTLKLTVELLKRRELWVFWGRL